MKPMRVSMLVVAITATAGACGRATEPLPPTDVDGPTSDGGTLPEPAPKVGTGAGEFELILNPSSVALAPGGSQQVVLELRRSDEATGEIALSLQGLPAEVTGVFDAVSTAAKNDALTLHVGPTVPAGNYCVTVKASNQSVNRQATLMLRVTGQANVLLVDDDRSDNNSGRENPTTSPSDAWYSSLLNGMIIGYDTHTVPADQNGPKFDQLKNYQTIIWYTGDEYGGLSNIDTISSADEINLRNFLDLGGKRVILASGRYTYGSDSQWDKANNDFLSNTIGAVGARYNVVFNVAFTATGAGAFAGFKWDVKANDPVETYPSAVNPKTGTDTLATMVADPDSSGTARPVAVIVGRKNVGAASTSTIVYLGLPMENIEDGPAGSGAQLMQKMMDY